MRNNMKNKHYRCWGGILSVMVGVSLMGCSTFQEPRETSPRDPEIKIERLDISLDSDANLDSATSIDLVMVYKMDLMKALMKMSAADYYASADQIRRDYPDMVDIWHWELTPGQVVQNYPITVREYDPVGAIVFANYATPGDHRIRLGSVEHAHLRLKRHDFCILEQGCAPSIIRESIREQYPKDQIKVETFNGHMQSAATPAYSSQSTVKSEMNEVKDTVSSAKSLVKELSHF
jgi:type VI secretion system protein